MKFSGVQGEIYKEGMFLNKQEWRDNVIIQLVFIRHAIYFVGFVIAVTQSVSFFKAFGFNEAVNEGVILLTHFFILMYSAAYLYRAASKSNYFDKRYQNTIYDED